MSCIGSMYRFEQFIACVALMSGLGICQMLKGRKKDVFKRVRRPLFGVLVMLLLSFGLKGFDTFVYQSDPQWKQYTEYNELRTELLDYDFPEYEDYEEEYEQLGITEDAYNYGITGILVILICLI